MISRTILTSSIALAALLAQPKTDAPKPGIATATKEARPGGLPKDATEVEPGLWKHTDGAGKTWMFRRTPFGVSKYPAAVADEESANDEKEAQMLKAVDAGDSVKFERKMPFGVTKWTRKKSELKGAEAIAWKKASSSGQPTATRAASEQKGVQPAAKTAAAAK